MKTNLHGADQDASLLAWWLDELDEAESAAFDEHLFGCDACTTRLRELLQLRESVRKTFHESEFGTAVTPGFVQRLRDSGRRLREYHVDAGGSVMCTIAPDDDFVVSRMHAPLAGVRQVDLVYENDSMQHRWAHIPFDAASNEVTFLPPVALLRSMGASTMRARLYAVTLDSERVIAEYHFIHRPWGSESLRE
jgi:hypothetical protein